MRTFLWFAAAMAVSMVLAQLVAVQLAIKFGTREEFIVVMVALGLFNVITMAVFSIVFVASNRPTSIDIAALVMMAVVTAIIGGLLGYGFIAGDLKQLSPGEWQIAAEFLGPALLNVVIQWWFIRRLRSRTVWTGAE